MTSNFAKKVDAFPTQLVLTIIWTVVAIPSTFVLAKTWYERMLLGVSFYAIIISHFTAYMAWRAKREAQGKGESNGFENQNS